MSFGFGFGLPSWQALSGGFTPASLFSAGEQGAWYDPTDVSISWRRNLLTYTEQFDNAVWTKIQATITTNAIVAPDGTTTAEAFTETLPTAQHAIFQTVNIASSVYTLSVFAKQGSGAQRWLTLYPQGSGIAAAAIFDLTSGSVTSTGLAQFISASISAAGNNWYRCSITFTGATTGVNCVSYLSNSSNTFAPSYAGDGTSGVYLWGAQLELGSTASLYQQIVTPEITYLQTIQPSPVLFTDSAGTTPVTGVEQFVGLMLDKSKGAPTTLGPELVTNGTFNTNTSGWTPQGSTLLSVVSGNLRVQTGYATQLITTVVGQWYTFSVDVNVIDTGGVYLGTTLGGFEYVSSGGISSNKKYIFQFRATSTTLSISLWAWNGGSTACLYDNVTVKALPGNHATSTGTKRPKLAARYNLLTYSEDFSNAAWIKNAVTVTTDAIVAPNGTTTADLIVPSSGAYVLRTLASAATDALCARVYAKSGGTQSDIELGAYAGPNSAIVVFNVLTMSKTVSQSGTGSVISSNIVDVGNGWKLLSVFFTGVASANIPFSPRYNAAQSGGMYLWGADLRPTSQATGLIGPTYQRVAAATDYDTVGFLPYLAFDGIDDSMSTGSIDFTATDKMTVWAGVRKLSDAALAMVGELSANAGTNNGSFFLAAPRTGTADYGWRSTGTILSDATAAASYAAPITNVLAAIGNISGDIAALRVNGTQVATSSTDQGFGNYGNYPLFIGQRNNTSLPFNGWLSSLIIRGAQSTDSQISATESWVNGRTGAY
jgi:hypothetical protein